MGKKGRDSVKKGRDSVKKGREWVIVWESEGDSVGE